MGSLAFTNEFLARLSTFVVLMVIDENVLCDVVVVVIVIDLLVVGYFGMEKMIDECKKR